MKRSKTYFTLKQKKNNIFNHNLLNTRTKFSNIIPLLKHKLLKISYVVQKNYLRQF